MELVFKKNLKQFINKSMKKMYIILIILIGIPLVLLIIGWRSNQPVKLKATEYFMDSKIAVLAEAADKGDTKGVEQAVFLGALPNAEGKEGITPLLYVLASSRNKNGLRALLKAGADPNKFSADGLCPMVLSVRAEDREFLEIMLANGGNPNLNNASGEPVLQVAARDDRWDNAINLLDHGADINGKDQTGFTTMMNLVALRRYNRISDLIDRGADVNVKTANGTNLAKLVKTVTVAASSDQLSWREKVIGQLGAKGVSLPN